MGNTKAGELVLSAFEHNSILVILTSTYILHY